MQNSELKITERSASGFCQRITPHHHATSDRVRRLHDELMNGILTVKHAPTSAVETTSSVPECASTICLQMNKPSLSPPPGALDGGLQKGSNTLRCKCSGIGFPSFETVRTTSAASLATHTITGVSSAPRTMVFPIQREIGEERQ
jgi:hypothetical protein